MPDGLLDRRKQRAPRPATYGRTGMSGDHAAGSSSAIRPELVTAHDRR